MVVRWQQKTMTTTQTYTHAIYLHVSYPPGHRQCLYMGKSKEASCTKLIHLTSPHLSSQGETFFLSFSSHLTHSIFFFPTFSLSPIALFLLFLYIFNCMLVFCFYINSTFTLFFFFFCLIVFLFVLI